jgi:hypothetical protein
MKAIKFLTLLFGLLIFTATASAQHGRGGYAFRGNSSFRGGYAPRASYGYGFRGGVRPGFYAPYYAARPFVYGCGYPARRFWVDGYWGFNPYGVQIWFPGYWRIY